MRRRAFLQTAGLSFVGLQLGLLAGCGQDAGPILALEPGDSGAAGAVKKLAARLRGTDFVGPVCANEINESEPIDALLDLLRTTRQPTLHEAFLQSIQRDFRNGDRVEVAGWQLSRTECLLLAAAAIEQGLSEPRRIERGTLRFEPFAEIERWGPQETIEGQIFNPIGNGRGGFWIRVADSVPGSTRLMFDDVMLATHFEPGVVTASLEPDHMDQVISQPGIYPLLMIDTARNIAQKVGYLTVRPQPPAATLPDGSQSTVFCQVERWGPNYAPRGQAFNEQSDGSAAFWVRIGCAPQQSVLLLDGESLPTSVSTGLVTARVPHYAELASGGHELAIYDPQSGERLPVGTFEIL